MRQSYHLCSILLVKSLIIIDYVILFYHYDHVNCLHYLLSFLPNLHLLFVIVLHLLNNPHFLFQYQKYPRFSILHVLCNLYVFLLLILDIRDVIILLSWILHLVYLYLFSSIILIGN